MQNDKKCLDWGDLNKAKILLIGHDPTLQRSDTIAEYCLFANYYFKPFLTKASDKSKFKLAKSTFDQIKYLTCDNFSHEEMYLTNICNYVLEHSPKKKEILIPKNKAVEGLVNINNILINSKIKFVFTMSLQVNYWLQEMNFYLSDNDFLQKSKPNKKGIDNKPPYYEALESKSFKLICGNIYQSKSRHHNIIPILHPKNFPLRGRFITYQKPYDKIREYFVKLSGNA